MNYMKANLGNLCYAFGALYLLEKNYLRKIGTNKEIAYMGRSELFEPKHQSYAEGSTFIVGN